MPRHKYQEPLKKKDFLRNRWRFLHENYVKDISVKFLFIFLAVKTLVQT
jgi:hypothetical protein